MLKPHYAVVGLNFGDEGKGLVVDYLARQHQDAARVTIVRNNGGAQAAHTVQRAGHRHVFHSLSSGSLLPNVETYWGPDFIINPEAVVEEIQRFTQKTGIIPTIVADDRCRVTCPTDIVNNLMKEQARGTDRHGSCGHGIHETVVRHQHIPLYLGDLRQRSDADLDNLKETAQLVKTVADQFGPTSSFAPLFEGWVQALRILFKAVTFVQSSQHVLDTADVVIHEGAQGLLLDQSNMDYFPHLTHSCTGASGMLIPAAGSGFQVCKIHYVSRSYLTRHGAGPLPGEMDLTDFTTAYPAFEDKTNKPNPWQGDLRVSDDLVIQDLMDRAVRDSDGNGDPVHIFTCTDHKPLPSYPYPQGTLVSCGPTADDVTLLVK